MPLEFKIYDRGDIKIVGKFSGSAKIQKRTHAKFQLLT